MNIYRLFVDPRDKPGGGENSELLPQTHCTL